MAGIYSVVISSTQPVRDGFRFYGRGEDNRCVEDPPPGSRRADFWRYAVGRPFLFVCWALAGWGTFVALVVLGRLLAGHGGLGAVGWVQWATVAWAGVMWTVLILALRRRKTPSEAVSTDTN